MRNEKIINSWSKIKPDDTTHERILNNILERTHYREIKKVNPYPKILNPITACVIIALTITIPIYAKARNKYSKI